MNFVRTLLLTLMSFLATQSQSIAQLKLPDLSYAGEIRQKVGFTNFTVNYERPMQRGRAIFGALVPYGKPWKTGAGFANTIAFDRDVMMGGKRIPKGRYLLVTIPGPDLWKVILSTDSIAFSKNKPYEPEKEVARVEVAPAVSEKHYEAMTIGLDIVGHDAVFTVSWDHTSVSFIIETGTLQQTMRDIRAMMKKGDATPEAYSDAARFIAYNLSVLPATARDTALILVNMAIENDPQSWMYSTKRSVYWFAGDFKNYDAVTREWIKFLKKDPAHDPEDVAILERDLLSKVKRM